ncbi:MAG: Z1 domain-containing protein, partial [Ruminococcus sp.]|nr:Z1 domain-containing protein [Ruminococcus sp.]
YSAIKFNLNCDDFEESMKNPVLRKIYDVWEQHFSSVEFEWDDIADILLQSINPIVIKVVNSSRKDNTLVYPENDGIRVIAVGGLALSRGLTLEGLIISYFYRNTCTYDVLMQMGRWFGYRHGYEDLFRIWIGEKTAEWYADIARATEELKSDMNTMNMERRTPKEFGIRVRNDSEELQITSPNKMRNAKDEIVRYSYFGDIIETPYLVYNPRTQKENFRYVKEFIESLVSAGMAFELSEGLRGQKRHIIQKVPKKRISGLLENVSISECNSRFKPSQIISFLGKCNDPSVALFDIAFINGTSGKYVEIADMDIQAIRRGNCEIDTERDLLCIGRRGKIGGPTDGKTGIFDTADRTRDDIIEEAEKRFREYYKGRKQKEFDEKSTYPGETWFRYVKDRRPLLIIYLIDAQEYSEKSKDDSRKASNQKEVFRQFEADMNGIPSVGFAIGFPENNNSSVAEIAAYSANRFCNWFELNDILAESEEE